MPRMAARSRATDCAWDVRAMVVAFRVTRRAGTGGARCAARHCLSRKYRRGRVSTHCGRSISRRDPGAGRWTAVPSMEVCARSRFYTAGTTILRRLLASPRDGSPRARAFSPWAAPVRTGTRCGSPCPVGSLAGIAQARSWTVGSPPGIAPAGFSAVGSPRGIALGSFSALGSPRGIAMGSFSAAASPLGIAPGWFSRASSRRGSRRAGSRERLPRRGSRQAGSRERPPRWG